MVYTGIFHSLMTATNSREVPASFRPLASKSQPETTTGCPPRVDACYHLAAKRALETLQERQRILGKLEVPKGLKPVTGVNQRSDGRYMCNMRRWVKQGEGKRQISIIKPGERLATDDLAYANEFYAHLSVLMAEGTEDAGHTNPYSPFTYMATYLTAKVTETARGRNTPVSRTQILTIQNHLELIFCETSFKDIVDIRLIRRRDITRLASELWDIPTVRGRPPSDETVRKRLHALSGMLSFAKRQDDITDNPLNEHTSIPASRSPEEAQWLELEEVRDLLRTLYTMNASWKARSAYYIAAMMFYTGARLKEIMRMRPADADPNNQHVIINSAKKSGRGRRLVPYWPTFKEIMEEYWERFKPTGTLLFPGITVDGKGETERGGILGTLRKAAELAGLYTPPVYKTERVPASGRKQWKTIYVYETIVQPDGKTVRRRVLEKPHTGKKIGHHTARHTYISIRLGMLRDGHPIDLSTVMRETGHEKEETIRQVYAHAMQRRHAMEELDYGTKD